MFIGAGCPIRKSPDHGLLATSPERIAGTPRPSSPSRAKASTICPSTYPHTYGVKTPAHPAGSGIATSAVRVTALFVAITPRCARTRHNSNLRMRPNATNGIRGIIRVIRIMRVRNTVRFSTIFLFQAAVRSDAVGSSPDREARRGSRPSPNPALAGTGEEWQRKDRSPERLSLKHTRQPKGQPDLP